VTYTDQVITCSDCGIDFVFSASEQEFFAEKGFASAPKRCASCRARCS
jgi:N-acetylglutamate synthase-like GNAT family acetyltransferase